MRWFGWPEQPSLCGGVSYAAQRLGVSGAAGRRGDRHGGQHATTLKQRAQPRGRASGVCCTPMLGGVVENIRKKHSEYRAVSQ